MSVCRCLHSPPQPEILIRFMQMEFHPLKKCKWGLLLCSVVSVWQQLTFLSSWQVRIRAASRNKVILQRGPSLGSTCTPVIFLTHRKMLISDFRVL